MLPVVLALSFAATIIALLNWRHGIIAMLFIGVIQDPVRKLIPGAPPSYVLWAGCIFAMVAAFALLNRAVTSTRPLGLGSSSLANAWGLYFILIGLQAVNTFLRWGSFPVVVLGLIFYLAPVAALLVSIAYANSERQIIKFMKAYVWIMVPAVLTVYLSPDYADTWPVLRDVGTFIGRELVIYDIGRALKSHPGIFRVGEIAAWHAAMAVCFMVILMHGNKSRFHWVVAAIVIALLVGAIILTGRRKMIMALTIFLVTQWGLVSMYGRGAGRQALAVMLLGVVGSLAFVLLDDSEVVNPYLQRGGTVFEDSVGRIMLSYHLLESAFHRSEFFGLGAGVTSLGSRFVGLNTGASYAAEAGTGMIMVELGVPGVIVVLVLLFVATRRILAILKRLAHSNEKLFYFAVSLFAMLVANGMTFLVATQLFSDPFVLIVLGLMAGFLFAICQAETRAFRQRAIQRMQQVTGGAGRVAADGGG